MDRRDFLKKLPGVAAACGLAGAQRRVLATPVPRGELGKVDWSLPDDPRVISGHTLLELFERVQMKDKATAEFPSRGTRGYYVSVNNRRLIRVSLVDPGDDYIPVPSFPLGATGCNHEWVEQEFQRKLNKNAADMILAVAVINGDASISNPVTVFEHLGYVVSVGQRPQEFLVLPYRQWLKTFRDDDTGGYYGFAEIGMACLDGRRVSARLV